MYVAAQENGKYVHRYGNANSSSIPKAPKSKTLKSIRSRRDELRSSHTAERDTLGRRAVTRGDVCMSLRRQDAKREAQCENGPYDSIYNRRKTSLRCQEAGQGSPLGRGKREWGQEVLGAGIGHRRWAHSVFRS